MYANLKLSMLILGFTSIPFSCFSESPRVFLAKMFSDKVLCSQDIRDKYPKDSLENAYWQGRMDSYNHGFYVFMYCNFDPVNCEYTPPEKYLDDPCDYGIKP